MNICGEKKKKNPKPKLENAKHIRELDKHGQIFVSIKKHSSLLAKLAGSLKSDPNWPPAQAPYYRCTTQQYSRALCVKLHPNI